MNLKDSHCIELSIGFSVPYDKLIWGRMVRFFEAKKGTVKKKGARSIAISATLASGERTADYHYHFLARRSVEKRIEFTIGIHKNKSYAKLPKRPRELEIMDPELWLLGLLGKKFEERKLNIDIDANFAYRKSAFVSVLPIPFKRPLEIPNIGGVLGDVSITGLNFRLENSEAGLRSIYFETLQKTLRVMTSFGQEIVLAEGLFGKLLSSAAKITMLFVKEESNDGKD